MSRDQINKPHLKKQFQSIITQAKDSGQRLDQFLAEQLDLSRNQVQNLIKREQVYVNTKKANSGLKLKEGMEIRFHLDSKETHFSAEELPLEILYENDDILVINKAPGVVVHPAKSGYKQGTVVNALLHHLGKSKSKNARPGIVHRLDKDTSGVLLLAKTKKALEKYRALFKNREVEKTYLALVRGCPKTEMGRIDAPIARSVKDRTAMGISEQGKRAVSRFAVLARYNGVSLLKVQIETGRTHQIRVHLACIGHPVVGDASYGDRRLNKQFEEKHGLTRQFLHAETLKINGKSYTASLSPDLEAVLTRLS